MAWNESGILCFKYTMEILCFLGYFQNGAIYHICGCDVMKFLNHMPDKQQILIANFRVLCFIHLFEISKACLPDDVSIYFR